MVRKLAALAARLMVVGLLLPVLYLIRPWRRVRIGHLMTERIGHLAINVDLYMRRRQAGREPAGVLDIFIANRPCNRQLLTMWQRHLPIIENRLLSFMFLSSQTILERTPFFVDTPVTNWDGPGYDLGVATLSFTPEEEARGRADLAGMGMGPDDWFICFHSRDSAYLARQTPGYDRSHEDFRNCSVLNYLKAAEAVAAIGGYALRMGEVTAEALPDGLHPRIIDYARKHRSDFLDIYLPAKCRFFLGCTSGLYLISSIFDVPAAAANYVQLATTANRTHDLFIPKLARRKADGTLVPFAELYRIGAFFFEPDKFKQHAMFERHGLEWVENSPEEILDLALDMLDRLKGVEPAAEIREMQRQYHTRFRSHIPDHLHSAALSPRFIQRHRDLLA